MIKKGETALEKHRRKKLEMEQDQDYLRQVETPGGAQFVKDTIDAERATEQQVVDNVMSDLENKKKFQFSYRSGMASYLKDKLEAAEFPEKWVFDTLATDGSPIRVFGKAFNTNEGVVCILKSPTGQVYIKAVLTAYDPEIDVGAMDTLAVQVENTIDSARGLLLSDKKAMPQGYEKSKSGLILPSK